MKLFNLVFVFFASLWVSTSQAVMTEVGLSHSYKKSYINEDNFTESQSTTGSISFYIWARSAIEFSYTHAVSLREELISQDQEPRTIRQTAEVLGLDFVFGFADRKAPFQPYIKGGVAHIDKILKVQQGIVIPDGAGTIDPEAEIVPSAGIGAKILLTETFAFKISLDAWGTQSSNEVNNLDTAFSAGITWLL